MEWLSHPEKWDRNGGDGPFNDKKLARIVFATTLSSAVNTPNGPDPTVLKSVTERLSADQTLEGYWKLDGEDHVGSPASYGQGLATLMARNTLLAADPARYRTPIDRANTWMISRDPNSVFDAAVGMWATAEIQPAQGSEFRRRCLDLIRRGRNEDGGWGPYEKSASEVFDSALVLLALTKSKAPGKDISRMIQGGRAFLIGQQTELGNWTETTRPTGSESYAQRISTTGWALLALLETRAASHGTINAPRP